MRTASEVLRSLEYRIARLERQSARERPPAPQRSTRGPGRGRMTDLSEHSNLLTALQLIYRHSEADRLDLTSDLSSYNGVFEVGGWPGTHYDSATNSIVFYLTLEGNPNTIHRILDKHGITLVNVKIEKDGQKNDKTVYELSLSLDSAKYKGVWKEFMGNASMKNTLRELPDAVRRSERLFFGIEFK